MKTRQALLHMDGERVLGLRCEHPLNGDAEIVRFGAPIDLDLTDTPYISTIPGDTPGYKLAVYGPEARLKTERYVFF